MRAIGSQHGLYRSLAASGYRCGDSGFLKASDRLNPTLADITFERLQAEGSLPLAIPPERVTPFADGVFGTPSGKVEIYSARAAASGNDPVPGWVAEVEARTAGTPPAAHDLAAALSWRAPFYQFKFRQ